MRTRVKICGITRREDALVAAAAGADAIGLVFHAASPRHVSIDTAARVVGDLPPFVTVVGLFVDARPDYVESVLGQTRIDLLQFHGDETDAQCGRYGRPYIKALRMRDGIDLPAQAGRYPGAAAVLLDSYSTSAAGGTGESFDWDRVPREFARRTVLAGGLNPANVAQAIQRLRPYAVDVSSGVESAPGIKDSVLIEAFMRSVSNSEVAVQ